MAVESAENTLCVFESPPKPAHSIDALLLFADHAITHSSLRKILAVQPLNEGQKTARSGHRPKDALGPKKPCLKKADMPMLLLSVKIQAKEHGTF